MARNRFVLGFRCALALLCMTGAAATPCAAQVVSAARAVDEPPGLEPYVEQIAGTLVSFEMLPIPGGAIQLASPDAPRRTVDVAPFWMMSTETTWDLYDVYVYGLDRRAGRATDPDVDAVSHPSKPYVLPGEHFGHDGHPALAVSFHAARTFAQWLSVRTGRTYRLPTEAEWRLACHRGQTQPERSDGLGKRAWYAANAGDRTHPVGSLAPNAFGLHDLLGNVAEWVVTARGEPVAMGGAFDDSAEAVRCAAGRVQTAAWNATDPQLPKSRWWLSDAPFVGFRLVREDDRRPD